MSSVGAPLIPSICAASHVSLGTGEWLLTIALLTGALATPIMGRLADGPHPRRVIARLRSSVVLVGSVLAAVDQHVRAARPREGLQGMGLGILPVTMAVARRHLPMERASRTIAILSVTAGVGVGLGYPITGVLAEFFRLPRGFLVQRRRRRGRPDALAAGAPRRVGRRRKRPFDTIGARPADRRRRRLHPRRERGRVMGLGIGGRARTLLGRVLRARRAWARYELGRHEPLVDLRHARNRLVLTADISGLSSP